MSQIEQDAGRDPITERPYCPSCLKNDNLMILMSYDYSQTKMMRVDERLVHIFKAVSEAEGKGRTWSKQVDLQMWFLCKNLYPELTNAILESYAMAEDVIENEPIVKEIIKND